MLGDLCGCGYGFGSFLGSLVHDVEHTVNPIFPVTDVAHALTHHQSGTEGVFALQESQESMPLPPAPVQFHPMAVNTVHNHIHNHHHLHHTYIPQPPRPLPPPPVGFGWNMPYWMIPAAAGAASYALYRRYRPSQWG